MEDSNITYVHNLLPIQENFSIDYSQMDKKVAPSPLAYAGQKEIDFELPTPVEIEKYLLLHPAVPTGIDIRANKLVGKGYQISGNNEEAVDYCKKILYESGGNTFVKRFYKNAIGWGTSFTELVPNKDKSEILKCDILHPIYFNFLKQKKMIDNKEKWITVIDSKSKLPKAYSQYKINDMGEWETVGAPISPDRAAYLALDTWGDEFEGISIITYLKATMKNLFDTEDAGAHSAYLTANPRYAFTTNITNPEDLKSFGDGVGSMNEKDVVVLTEGTDVKVLQPGITNFPEFHKRFLLLIASKLQIPLPLLISDATSTNKSTLDKQLEFLDEQLVADEYVLKDTIEKQIFEVACKIKFGENFKQEDIPKFDFNPFIDSMKEIELIGEKTKLVERMARSIKMMHEIERPDVANLLINQLTRLFRNDLLTEHTKEKTDAVRETAQGIEYSGRTTSNNDNSGKITDIEQL